MISQDNAASFLIVFIGTFSDMTIIGHQGGQRIAVRFDAFSAPGERTFYRVKVPKSPGSGKT